MILLGKSLYKTNYKFTNHLIQSTLQASAYHVKANSTPPANDDISLNLEALSKITFH